MGECWWESAPPPNHNGLLLGTLTTSWCRLTNYRVASSSLSSLSALLLGYWVYPVVAPMLNQTPRITHALLHIGPVGEVGLIGWSLIIVPACLLSSIGTASSVPIGDQRKVEKLPEAKDFSPVPSSVNSLSFPVYASCLCLGDSDKLWVSAKCGALMWHNDERKHLATWLNRFRYAMPGMTHSGTNDSHHGQPVRQTWQNASKYAPKNK